MRALRTTCLAAVLAIGFADAVAADADVSRFFGSYTGFGFASDTTGPFINTERDFELGIGPYGEDGFEVAWSTVKRKGSDPNRLEAEVSHQRARFRPSGTPGIYHGTDGGDVLGGAALEWARVDGNFLIVYQLAVEASGIPELHVYRRMLTPRGLELLFTATRDGELVRTVRGRYRRR